MGLLGGLGQTCRRKSLNLERHSKRLLMADLKQRRTSLLDVLPTFVDSRFTHWETTLPEDSPFMVRWLHHAQ